MSKKTGMMAVIALAALAAAGGVYYVSRANHKEPPRHGLPHHEYRPPGEAESLKGRDFVRLGEPGSVEGSLKRARGEWFLVAGNETYELHLGDHAHRAATGINLEEGKHAEVTGFIYAREGRDEVDIAVCTILLDGTEYRFREDDGTPLWRGSGAGLGPGKQR